MISELFPIRWLHVYSYLLILFLKNRYIFFISFLLLHSYRSGWNPFFFFFFFLLVGSRNPKFPSQLQIWVGLFFCFFFLLVGSRDPKFPSTNLPFLFPSYFCSLFPCEHREPHQLGSYPLTFTIVAHPWNSIYGGVLVVEIWTSLICLQRALFRPSQTRQS